MASLQENARIIELMMSLQWPWGDDAQCCPFIPVGDMISCQPFTARCPLIQKSKETFGCDANFFSA
jgi:hypothetical protein